MLLLNKTLPVILSPIGITVLGAASALLLRRPRLVWLALAWLWLCSMPITGNLLIRAAEQGAVRLPAETVQQAQAVVVLSGMARTVNAPPSSTPYVREWGDAVDRLEGGLALMRAKRAPRLIFTGGRVPWDVLPTTEGDWLMEHARNRGLPAAAISITPPVQNTAEEAQAVAAMLKGSPSPHILLVTSAFHMPRAKALFEAQGLRVTPYPVDFRARTRSFTILDLLPDAEALDNSSIAFREALGRAFYAVTAALRS
ncbi:MAG: YdcF family protein [Betaproteobacteria bacterium]|nr:YdcF family protein [Betaproteobacteria bacterium]NCV06536.1 YdcF family protein [Betaproteobacteria bacterium]